MGKLWGTRFQGSSLICLGVLNALAPRATDWVAIQIRPPCAPGSFLARSLFLDHPIYLMGGSRRHDWGAARSPQFSRFSPPSRLKLQMMAVVKRLRKCLVLHIPRAQHGIASAQPTTCRNHPTTSRRAAERDSKPRPRMMSGTSCFLLACAVGIRWLYLVVCIGGLEVWGPEFQLPKPPI